MTITHNYRGIPVIFHTDTLRLDDRNVILCNYVFLPHIDHTRTCHQRGELFNSCPELVKLAYFKFTELLI